MDVILPLLGILAALGYWLFVLKRAGDGAAGIVDAAGRARGTARGLARRAAASRMDAIDDPRVAAATMAVAVAACEGGMSERQEAVLGEAMTTMLGIFDPTESLIFAKWAAGDGVDPDNVSLRLARLWNATLDMSERAELVEFVTRVAAADGEPSAAQLAAIARLKRRLALPA